MEKINVECPRCRHKFNIFYKGKLRTMDDLFELIKERKNGKNKH